jgi:predicted transport protein
MPLFKINADQDVTQIKSLTFSRELELQKLCEKNLETLFSVRFIASEFSIGQQQPGRIDTLGLDREGSPVIIEYKKTHKDSIINQGLFYMNWLLDHRGDFTLAAQKVLGNEIYIDWSHPRLILVAETFSTYDKFAVNQIGANIELWTYIRYGENLFHLEPIFVSNKLKRKNNIQSPKETKGSEPDAEKIENEIYDLDTHLFGKSQKITDLFYEFQERVLALNPDDAIIEKINKNIISYRHGKNFCELWIQASKIKLWLDIPILELEDPYHLAEDVSEKGHWGTGDVAVNLASLVDLDKVMDLVAQAYQQTV